MRPQFSSRCRLRKGTELCRVPCYNAFRELLPMLDLGQMPRLLGAWLTQHEGTLPRTLALDGKVVRTGVFPRGAGG